MTTAGEICGLAADGRLDLTCFVELDPNPELAALGVGIYALNVGNISDGRYRPLALVFQIAATVPLKICPG